MGKSARYCARSPSTFSACVVREHKGGLTRARHLAHYILVLLLPCPLPIPFCLFRVHLFHSFHQTIFIG